MPNIDEEARRWELDLDGRVGRAALARRKKLGLTAVAVAERTKELDYPITRVTISKIENNARAGKIDVAELLVLATALEVPPTLLLFPDFPDGQVEVLPNLQADSVIAARWLFGVGSLPRSEKRSVSWASRMNAGIELVGAMNEARDLGLSQLRMQAAIGPEEGRHASRLMQLNQERLDQLERSSIDSIAELWFSDLPEDSDE